jgi:hypothetical protein
MKQLCPVHFESFDPDTASSEQDQAACRAECGLLTDRKAYDPNFGGADERDLDDNVPTVQCRLWHLGAAAIELTESGVKDNHHCGHAVGESECLPAPAGPAP